MDPEASAAMGQPDSMCLLLPVGREHLVSNTYTASAALAHVAAISQQSQAVGPSARRMHEKKNKTKPPLAALRPGSRRRPPSSHSGCPPFEPLLFGLFDETRKKS
ncbi:hypothetical protein BS50DRAFT_574030 [Corynespora cassiicola Philippines]|uniref:Uncharacterized protein n=1 Tax=Corynespora cassiicola Philippines TaxID=1448308 RepID=A0A2T2NQF7_CORCC|nr:hypothetical protein BS50DRAFT_574030 [Corynespora cassiicola Philippines]